MKPGVIILAVCLFLIGPNLFGRSDSSGRVIKMDRLQSASSVSKTFNSQETNPDVKSAIVLSSLNFGFITSYGFGLDGFVTYSTSPIQPVNPQFGIKLRNDLRLDKRIATDSLNLQDMENEFLSRLKRYASVKRVIDSLHFKMSSPSAPDSLSEEFQKNQDRLDSLQQVTKDIQSSIDDAERAIEDAKSSLEKLKSKRSQLSVKSLGIGRIAIVEPLFNNQPVQLNGISTEVALKRAFFVRINAGANKARFLNNEYKYQALQAGIGIKTNKTLYESGLIALSGKEKQTWLYGKFGFTGKQFSFQQIVYMGLKPGTPLFRYSANGQVILTKALLLKAGVNLTDNRLNLQKVLPGIVLPSAVNSAEVSLRYTRKTFVLDMGTEHKRRQFNNVRTIVNRHKVTVKYKLTKAMVLSSVNIWLDTRSTNTTGALWKSATALSNNTLLYKYGKTWNLMLNGNFNYSGGYDEYYQHTAAFSILKSFNKLSVGSVLGWMREAERETSFGELTLSVMGKVLSWSGNIHHDRINGLRYTFAGRYTRKLFSAAVNIQSWQNPALLYQQEQPVLAPVRFTNVNLSLSFKII